MIPMTGDRFGPYEILGTLGRGGVGEVYRAWDDRLAREVALKVLHEDYPMAGNRERFLIEARAASALSHANICTVFDMGQKNGWPYLVMELLKGITLKQRIERGPMGADEIVRVASEVAAALGAAHALGIIHRDIKPANVMLTRQADGRTRVKVLDFGLAKLTEPLPGRLTRHDEHLTVAGEAVGTVSYMSPEQARGDGLDGRSDLFSLGVVMYEMATRRTPFHGTTTALLFAQLLGKDPEPIREWNESIPRGLDKIIMRLLEKDPAERYQGAEDLIKDLEKVSRKLGGSGWWKKPSPAVALVRVEEPVARRELPARPGFLREAPRVAARESTGVMAYAEREAEDGTSQTAPEPLRAFTRGQFARVADAAAYEMPARPEWRKRVWMLGGVAAAAVCAAGALFTVRAAGNHGSGLSQGDSLMITAVENHTGVQTLDGSVAEGLEFDLAESEALTVRTVAEFRTVVHAMGADGQPPSRALAQQVAEAAGARAFVYGEVREGEQGAHSSGAGYSLHVAVLETSSSRELASADGRADRTEEIPGAIDQVSRQLMRQLVGGSGSRDSGVRQVPLAREATGNLNALHSYAVAAAAQGEGRRSAALRSYALAAAADPGFVQAQMEWAWLAREAGAEVASGQASLRAMDAAQDRSARTVLLAEVAGELMGRGDAERAGSAAKTLLEQNGHDVAARLAMTRVMRSAGQYEKALRCAEQAFAAGVREGELFREAELSLIAMDRYGDALELEERGGRESLGYPEVVLTAAYLAGKDDAVASATADVEKRVEDAAFMAPARAAYLDNTGQLGEGESVWAETARTVRSQPAAAGAGELLLATGALNRALTGECSVALEFAHAAARVSAGPEAKAKAQLAGALCNDPELTADGDSSPETRAAVALVSGESATAATALAAAGSGSATDRYLHGMVQLQTGGAAEAAQDFQEVLSRRGALLLSGSALYPAAQFKLGRAYAETGDRGRSMEAYRAFLAVWDGAGSGDRLRVEASAGVRGIGGAPVLEREPARAPVVSEVAKSPVLVATRKAPLPPRVERRRDPFPTPAWLMPHDSAGPASGAGKGLAGGEDEVRKTAKPVAGADLE